MQLCTQQNFEDPLPQGVLEIPINLSVIKGIAEEKTYTKMKEFVSEIYMESEKILLNMKREVIKEVKENDFSKIDVIFFGGGGGGGGGGG